MRDCPIGDFMKLENGKSLIDMARNAGVSAASVLLSNPGTDPAMFCEGQVIVVPEEENVMAENGYDAYTVQEGESIGDVVRKHDVSVREIKQLNPGIDVFSIKKGDVIFVRCDEKKYKMKQGDTIISVAQMMGCDMIDLLRANEHLRPCEFVEGQSIILPPQKQG